MSLLWAACGLMHPFGGMGVAEQLHGATAKAWVLLRSYMGQQLECCRVVACGNSIGIGVAEQLHGAMA